MRTRAMISIPLALILFLVFPAAVPAQGAVRVFVDGDQVTFDQPPVTIGGRVLVPLRGIFEKMGATVVWVPATRTVRAQRGTTSVELQIGSRNASVDGRTVMLDVPAQIVGGRTLVPLRFVSEALGAQVDYNAATRTVTITTAGGGPPPPPPGEQTLRGILTAVSPGSAPPTITVESGATSTRIRISADTIITRVDASSGAGGSVSLSSLRRGDDVEVTMRDNTATRVRATYLMATGRLEAVARNTRTLVLSDGRTFRYVQDVSVVRDGRPVSDGAGALAAGQIVELRVNPTTREVWEVSIVSGGTTHGQMTLEVTRPVSGETVSSPVRVTGTTVAGARVEITVAYQGDVVGRRAVTADGSGRFDTTVSFTVRVRNATYLVIVKASHDRFGRAEKRVSVTAR
jgi:hypothetical protein